MEVVFKKNKTKTKDWMNRIAYLCHESRHPYHDKYAMSVDAERILAGFNIKSNSRIKRYFHSLKTILKFPYSKFDYIITDGPDLIPVIIKKLSFNRIKLISTQGNNHLVDYFNDEFSARFAKQFKYTTNQYDLIVCTGEIQHELAMKICEGNSKIKLEPSFNGVSEERFETLSKVNFNKDSRTIMSLSNQGTKYLNDMKGLDIMLKLFSELSRKFENLQYCHVGPYWEGLQDSMKISYPDLDWDRIKFVGRQTELEPWFSDAMCMFHLSRKDAFPFAVTEAFCAGIPVFISEGVGLKQMFGKIQGKEMFLLNSKDHQECISKLSNYVGLSKAEKQEIARRFKEASKDFTSKKAIANYKNIINRFIAKPNHD